MADSKRVRISKREGALMARLSAKEQEVYEVQASARDLYRARRPVTDFARQVYTDPAINVEFQLLTAQLAEMENSLRLKEAELKELRTTADKADKDKGKGAAAKGAGAAAKPPPAGGTGGNSGGAVAKGESTVARASALVARCQRLEQENEELAASADVAKVAQLTSEKAVAEAYAGELKTALEEAYEYIEKLEEEREVHSTKVYALEEELRLVASQPRLHGQQQEQQQQPQQGHEEQEQEQEQQQQHHQQQHQQHHHQQQQQQQQQHEEHHDPHQHQQHHQHQQQHDYHAAPQQRSLGAASSGSDMPQQSSPSSRDDKPSWNEAVQQQHDYHGGQRERRRGQGGEGEIGRNDHDDGGNSRPGSNDEPAPPPPPPPAAALETAATEDDMDDLYGDMGDAVGQAFEPTPAEGQEGPVTGASAGGDPMEEEEEVQEQEQEQEHRREETPPPVATRARSTRRSTRSRK
ncbi:unnamed protein product [Ectocarpus sp. 6 AP-2014]